MRIARGKGALSDIGEQLNQYPEPPTQRLPVFGIYISWMFSYNQTHTMGYRVQRHELDWSNLTYWFVQHSVDFLHSSEIDHFLEAVCDLPLLRAQSSSSPCAMSNVDYLDVDLIFDAGENRQRINV